MNKNLLIWIGVLVVVAIAGFYFLRGNLNPATTNQTAVTNAPTGPLKEFNITGKEYGFAPSTISVNAGESVKINFTNEGTTAHNLTIEKLNLTTKTIEPGKSDSITFTAGSAGTYTFYCSIDGHKNFGMEGSLEVK